MEILQQLKRYPFIVLLVPLITGLITGYYTDIQSLTLILVMIPGFLGFVIQHKYNRFSIGYFQGISIFLVFFSLGCLLMEMKQHTQKYEINVAKPALNVARILDAPSERTNSYRTRAVLLKQDSVSIKKYPQVIIYLYFHKDSSAQMPRPGDVVAFSSVLQAVENNGNPEEFDYRSYLQRRNIQFLTFIKPENYTIAGHQKLPWLVEMSHNFKAYAQHIFKTFIEEHAIISAMLLGERNELDPSLKSEFSKAGIMHILAISGLHVGLILLFLNTLFLFIAGNRILTTIRILLIICVLWLYAWITGFSPSVVRATLMFTFFTLGKLTSRKSSSYNILAFAAFVMLLINPYNIFEVGFQLSFLAVLSILYFYPRVYGIISVRYIIPDKIWQIVSVSIAAQVLTFPLTIYYFHQFSTWFLLANIIAIPVVFLVVLLSICLLALSQITFIANALGMVINLLISFLINGTTMVNNMPGNLLTGLHLEYVQLVVLYALLGAFMALLFLPNRKNVYVLISLIIVLINMKTFFKLETKSRSELVVFNVSGTSVISLLENKKGYCLLSDTVNDKSVSYATDNYFISRRALNGVSYQQMEKSMYPRIKLFNNSYYMRFNGIKIAILNDDITLWKAIHPIDLDYLIITGRAGEVQLNEIAGVFNVNQLIFDSTVNYYMLERMWNSDYAKHFSMHSVNRQGAFVLEI